jgi:hypothetical protein
MTIYNAAIPGLALAGLLVGCSVQFKAMNDKNETDMGSHHVVVIPGSMFTTSSSSSCGDNQTYQYSCGETTVSIRNEELIVNNVKYGTLAKGEAVLIDNGKVFVANQERKGTPMSDKDILASATAKESTVELAGYNVTVRPGSSVTSTTQILGKHTLTVGKTKVSIKKNELTVNGTSYGQLKQGDTILVENLKVFVSGKARAK